MSIVNKNFIMFFFFFFIEPGIRHIERKIFNAWFNKWFNNSQEFVQLMREIVVNLLYRIIAMIYTYNAMHTLKRQLLKRCVVMKTKEKIVAIVSIEYVAWCFVVGHESYAWYKNDTISYSKPIANQMGRLSVRNSIIYLVLLYSLTVSFFLKRIFQKISVLLFIHLFMCNTHFAMLWLTHYLYTHFSMCLDFN